MKQITKKLLAIILLFAVSSGVIMTALVMLPSPELNSTKQYYTKR
jgi:hypothetical protein